MSIHLKSQHLAEVLSTLLAPPLSGGGAEKRRATRIQVEAQVTIWPVVNASYGASTTVLTRDLSYSGVGLLQAKPAKQDDQFILRLPRPKAEPIMVLCQVTFVKKLADDLYGIGASFVSLLEHSRAPRTESAGKAGEAAGVKPVAQAGATSGELAKEAQPA